MNSVGATTRRPPRAFRDRSAATSLSAVNQPLANAERALQVQLTRIATTKCIHAIINKTSAVIGVFEGDVEVHATLRQRAATFVGANWQWLWTTIATPAVEYWYATVRKKRKNEPRKKKST